MNQKDECGIVTDLLPICVAREAGEASARLVATHLQTCPACRARMEALKAEREKQKQAQKANSLETHLRYFKWSSWAMAILASLLCGIVNWAVERRISWTWIAVGALICQQLPMNVYLRARRYRFYKALFCFSVLVPFMLGLIQHVLYHQMGTGGIWIWNVALPMSAIWLVTIWGGILFSAWRGFNGFGCIALLMLLSIPAEIATEAIAVGYGGIEFHLHWMTSILNLVTAAVFFIMSYLFTERSKRQEARRQRENDEQH